MPPVGAAVGGAFAGLSAALAASPLLAAAVQLGASVALSAAARALAPRPQSQAQTVSVRAPVVPRDLVYGVVRKGGTLIFAHRTRDGGNDRLHLIYALAGHRISGVTAIYLDGRLAWVAPPFRVINGQIISGGVQAPFTDSLVVATRNGDEDQTAITNSLLPTSVWGPNHRCRGVPLVYLRLRGESDDYPNGIPNMTALISGRDEIYDPRTDTFGFTRNAALCLADYMAWRRFGLGLGYGVEGGIDTATLIAAANVCDETVSRPGGGTEARYTCNGVLSSAATPKENIEALLTAMGGRAIYTADRWRIYAAAYQSPTVALTPADIRENGLTVQTRRSLADNFNRVRGQFVSPENDWQPDDFPAVTSSVYLAEDQGVESWRDLALPMTTSAGTAQRLAKIELERTRRQQVVQLSGMLSAWRAQVGDTVTLDYPRMGFNAKPFEVRKVTLSLADGAIVPELTLAEVSPLQYDWNATEEQIYAAAPRTDLPDPFQIAPPGSPQIQEELYETLNGVKTRVTITWPMSDGPFVASYEVQWRLTALANGTPVTRAFRTLVRTSETTAQIEDIALGTYQFRVRAVSTLGRLSAWVTTTRTIVGTDAPPVQLSEVTIQSAGGLAVLKWALPADLDVRVGGRVVIRHSSLGVAEWQNSVSMDEVAGNQTVAIVPLKPGTYLLRAKDAAGRLSPVVAVTTKGVQAIPFVNNLVLTEHPTFLGAKSNCVVNASNQLTLVNPALPGLYTFAGAIDFTVVRAVRLRSVVEASGVNPALLFGDMPGIFGETEGTFANPSGALIDVVVEGRFTDDNPGGTPTWTEWTRIDSNEVAFRAAQFRARLSVESASFNIILTALSVRADEVT